MPSDEPPRPPCLSVPTSSPPSGDTRPHHARAHPPATVAQVEHELGTPHAHPPSMDSFTTAARFVASVARQPLTLAEAAALLAFDPALAASVERHRELGRVLLARLRKQAGRARFRRRQLRART